MHHKIRKYREYLSWFTQESKIEVHEVPLRNGDIRVETSDHIKRINTDYSLISKTAEYFPPHLGKHVNVLA